MTRRHLMGIGSTAAGLAALGIALLGGSSARPARGEEGERVQEVELDLETAVPLALPAPANDLEPVAFTTPDGRKGWVIRLPGGRPIATPAVAEGRLFVGGGFGSHEFYAIDARTGAVVWQIKTSDDGPTAAVVEDGLVAFNTESCTVVVAEAATGKIVWEEWLGDPLMSQPAIADGRLYIAYPAGQRNAQQGLQQQDLQQQTGPQSPEQQPPPAEQQAPPQEQQAPPQEQQAPQPQLEAGPQGGGHRLLCADLRTGEHLWEQAIPADVISAPVLADGRVHLTCFDGTALCLDAGDGAVIWRRQTEGTSAPLVMAGQVVLTRKGEREGKLIEGMARLDAGGQQRERDLLAAGEAAHLAPGKGGGVPLAKGAQQSLDAGVGFSTAPQAANLEAANSNLGVQTVVGGWAYQGARVASREGRLYNAQGTALNGIGADGQTLWRAAVRGHDLPVDAQVFTPPALGTRGLYAGSVQGHLLRVDQLDGSVGFLYATGQPIVFQPALAGGSMFVGTASGLLICLETGDPDADGWSAWGGNAQHNKR